MEVPVIEASLTPSDAPMSSALNSRRFSLHASAHASPSKSRKSLKEGNRRSSVATENLQDNDIKPIAPLPVFKKPDKLPTHLDGTLRVVAVEKSQSMERDLIITLAYDEDKVVRAVETVKLPMLCSVDVDMAQEFVRGLVPRVVAEMMPLKSGKDPILVVADLEAEDEGENNFGMYFD